MLLRSGFTFLEDTLMTLDRTKLLGLRIADKAKAGVKAGAKIGVKIGVKA